MTYHQTDLGSAPGLGQGCAPCYIPAGGQCVACPEGSDLPECIDCVEGQLLSAPIAWYERPLAAPLIIGFTSAIVLGIAIPVARKMLGRRGITVE